MRDGTDTGTIPLDCTNRDCSKYGMHENYSHYLRCKNRKRNKGLFTSIQNLKGDSALYTRQDRQGTRYGYECPEERDYYPYWAESVWNDIAVLTDYQDCDNIRAAVRNYSGYCTARDQILRYTNILPHHLVTNTFSGFTGNNGHLPISKEECNQNSLTWVNDARSESFYCGKPISSRDNHHGNNGPDGHSKFTWKIPDDFPVRTPCVIRIRYNISTADFPVNIDST